MAKQIQYEMFHNSETITIDIEKIIKNKKEANKSQLLIGNSNKKISEWITKYGKNRKGTYIGRNRFLCETEVHIGNPFPMGRNTTGQDRYLVCNLFDMWIAKEQQKKLRAWYRTDITGKTLLCHCAPRRCHGISIARITNSTIEQEDQFIQVTTNQVFQQGKATYYKVTRK